MDKFKFYRRQNESIAQGALTNSKRPECFIKGIYPTHVSRGKGCHLWDSDGKKYIDYITGLGSSILGYAHDEINAAIYQRLSMGATLSFSTPVEIELAELIKQIVPFVDCMKFLKTGTEACLAAVRIARAYTGRNKILSHGYHGHGDEFISLTPPAVGVVPQWHIQSFNERLIDETVAAVILEPIVTDRSESRIEQLRQISKACKKSGTLLIFDEIITGFRFPKFCASNYFGLEPDIICLGKALGGGLPLSVVAGKYPIMNCGEYFVSSTFAGDTCALAAAQKTIQLLSSSKYRLSELWDSGTDFLENFNTIAPDFLQIVGYPTRGVFEGNSKFKALFWQEACKAGILFGASWFFNFPLMAESFAVLSTCKDIMLRIKAGQITLQGEMPQSPFAQRMRQ